MKLSTAVSLLAPLACQAVAYTQNASIAISGYQPYGVVEVPIVNTSIVPVTCTKFPFAVKNATLLPIVTPHNTSYTCAFLAQTCGFDLGEVTPAKPTATFQSQTWAAQCWWPFDPHTGLSYPIYP